MRNYEFFSPTKVIFGRGTENSVGEEIKKWGGTKVMTVHYGAPYEKNLMDKVFASLKAADIPYVDFDGVVPNPRLSHVRKGAEICKKEGVDFMLAIGGGSVIDTAKAIGLAIANEADIWDIITYKEEAVSRTPVGSILTIAATGSETSNGIVLTNEEGWLKRSYDVDICRPVFAIMNPELTYSLPKYQTASGCVDIMMHSLERYFSPDAESDLTDRLAESIFKTVIRFAPVLMHEPENYEARAEIMWAGSVSHNGMTGCGKLEDWTNHQLQHELGGMFDVAHGAGLSAVWASWARYVYKYNVPRFVKYAMNVWNCEYDIANPENTALEGIERTEKFFKSLDMPIRISELKGVGMLTEEQIQELSHKCSHFGKRTIGKLKVLDENDIANIFRNAR